MMKLSEVLSALQIPEAGELLASHWEDSEATFPSELPPFLDPDRCAALRAFTNLQPEVDPDLVAIARQVVANPALLHLAWHCHRLVYHHPEYSHADIARWPWLESTLGPNHGLFYLLTALSAVPQVQAFHAARAIPEAISRDTVSHYREAMRLKWVEAEGRWTVELHALYWTRYHAWGDLYSCGRMEYMVRPFSGMVQAYRHRASGQVLALDAGGHVFTAEGYINAGETVDSRPGNWESRFEDRGDTVVGVPIRATGQAINTLVELKRGEWDLVLKKGDPVLDTHIPAGGGFTPDRCEHSMRLAVDFFRQFFPDRPFVGFACGSWILDPEIRNWYDPQSNMVKWMDELYLFPYPSGPRTGMFFVFGSDRTDYANLPRDTSLRRAMADHLQAGGYCRAGGMFLLTEDLEYYGSQWYRRNWGGELLGL